jgi:ABC-type polysaccharide/polyol phosphate transport system ATPase subunit
MNDSFAIRVAEVRQRFKVVHERPDTLREAFAKRFRNARNFQDFDALKAVSFRVLKGEMLGVIGRNGSGKSTLLKVIAGVYKPTEGTVEVNGKVAALIELGAGFHPELTGRENITLNGLILGYSRKEMAERAERIIEFAELGDFIDSPVKQYSSGMYGRLAFAVATEVDPDILLLDEVLATGDAGFARKSLDRMERFHSSEKTILLVSHDLVSISRYCDRVLLIHQGQLLEDGPPNYVIERYKELIGLGVETPIT